MSDSIAAYAKSSAYIYENLYGQKVSQKKERVGRYLEEVEADFIFCKTVTPLAVGAGCALGGAIVGGSIGGPKGALIGSAVGFGSGTIAAIIYNMHSARKEYKKWLEKYRFTATYEDLIAFFKVDDVREKFLCSITLQPMIEPYVTKCDHTYEKTGITKWVRRNKSCPMCREDLKVVDLRPNFLIMGMQMKCYKDILSDLQDYPQLTDPQQEGIRALSKDLDAQIQRTFEKENKVLYKQLLNEDISRVQYAKKLQIIAESLEGDVSEPVNLEMEEEIFYMSDSGSDSGSDSDSDIDGSENGDIHDKSN